MTRTIYWLQISFTFGNMSGSGKEKKKKKRHCVISEQFEHIL